MQYFALHLETVTSLGTAPTFAGIKKSRNNNFISRVEEQEIGQGGAHPEFRPVDLLLVPIHHIRGGVGAGCGMWLGYDRGW
jgi:hypothetical protein